MFEAKQLSAGYGRAQVLWDVDLTIGDNEIVALVGPNGAGKTTLLRALTGMIGLESGDVQFRGVSLKGKSIEQVVALGISHVPEGRRLFAGLSVRDNLRLGGWRSRNAGHRPRCGDVPPVGRAAEPGRGQHVRWRAADVRHRAGAHEQAAPDDD